MSKPIEYYTGLHKSQLTVEFTRELNEKYHGDFYEWLNQRYDNLFEKLCDEINSSCDEYLNGKKDYYAERKLHTVIASHFKVLIDCAGKYRKEKGLDETSHFLNSLRE